MWNEDNRGKKTYDGKKFDRNEQIGEINTIRRKRAKIEVKGEFDDMVKNEVKWKFSILTYTTRYRTNDIIWTTNNDLWIAFIEISYGRTEKCIFRGGENRFRPPNFFLKTAKSLPLSTNVDTCGIRIDSNWRDGGYCKNKHNNKPLNTAERAKMLDLKMIRKIEKW